MRNPFKSLKSKAKTGGEPINDVVIDAAQDLVDKTLEALIKYLKNDSDLCNDGLEVGLEDTHDTQFWDNIKAAREAIKMYTNTSGYRIKRFMGINFIRHKLSIAFVHGTEEDTVATLNKFFVQRKPGIIDKFKHWLASSKVWIRL